MIAMRAESDKPKIAKKIWREYDRRTDKKRMNVDIESFFNVTIAAHQRSDDKSHDQGEAKANNQSLQTHSNIG